MNRRRSRASSSRSLGAERVFGAAAAKSAKRGQRPRRRGGAPASTRDAVLGSARARLRDSIDRWAARASERGAGGPGTRLIGLDVAQTPNRLQTRSWAPVIAAVVVGAMFLAVLRMDVIRMRFSVAQAFAEEMRLEEAKRELTVEMRQLRDPAILAQHAERLGFRRAERLVDLDAHRARTRQPAPPSSSPSSSRARESIALASAARGPEARP